MTKPDFQSQVTGYQIKRQQRRLWHKIVGVLACAVVFCTTYALILPAITMEKQKVLDCQYAVHQHTADCYDESGTLCCGKADFVLHTHDGRCYDENGELVCTLPEIREHVHTDACYTEQTGLVCELEETAGHEHNEQCCQTEQGELICQVEDAEHVHTDACYEKVKTLRCNPEQSEGAHEHTEDCYVLICGLETGAGAHTHTEACYGVEKTLTCGLQEAVAHTHTGACYDESGALVCTQPEVLEHVHTDECFRAEESEPDQTAYTYEDATISAEVTLAEGSTIPEGAVLSVRPITGAATLSEDGGSGYDYETLVRQAEQAVDKTLTQIVLYDISFYTPDGEYLPVEDSATVSLRFKQAVMTEDADEVAVLHYQQDAAAPVALTAVDVERGADNELSGVSFQTDGFSVFAVVTVTDGGWQKVKDVKDLDGKSVVITSHTAKYAMMAGATTDGNGCLAKAVTSTTDLSQYTFWTFERNADGTYYISSNGNYLLMGEQTLKTTTDKNQASAFTITITNGLAEIGASVNGTWYYINLFGGEDNQHGFKSYTSSSGNLQQLYIKADQLQGGVLLTDLGSKSFAIVNKNGASAYAMTTTVGSNLNGKATGLQNIPVSLVAAPDGTTYVTGNDVPMWAFEDSGTPGVYYIQATDGTYLNIGANSVMTSNVPQEITVTAETGNYAGQVMLSSGSNAINWYATDGQIFSAYTNSTTDRNNWQTLCQPLDASDRVLLYDLDVSTTMVGGHPIDYTPGSDWEVVDDVDEEPRLTDSDGNEVHDPVQTITADVTTLYGPGTPGEDGYFTHCGTARKAIRTFAPKNYIGTDFRFDGWAATVEDGSGEKNAYIFPAGAGATLKGDGIHITDTDGVERVLPLGTTLTAQWTEVSDLVLFFVNFTGTVLDTEGNVSGRNQKDFTGIIGIGRVYYGKEQAGSDSVFGNDANESIRLKFVNEFDPDDPEAQIVMEYVTAYDKTVTENPTASDPQAKGMGYNLYYGSGKNDRPIRGINDTELEAALLAFIQQNDNVTIRVSTADNANNPEIENVNATTDNYSVRWYVMKEQPDGWHIDGVMVAKTQEVTVAKTFSGLSAGEVSKILSYQSHPEYTGKTDSAGKPIYATVVDSYRIPIKLGEERSDYITMGAKGIDGQFEYIGQEAGGGQSYDWTLHAITDEQYTLSEENYELDGYDVSAVVVHYYRDEDGQLQISTQTEPTTENLDVEVVGGRTAGVSFNNFYTKTGTGAFAIHKSAGDRTGSNDVGSALQGATFALYTDAACQNALIDSDGNAVAVITNTRGSAYFNNLKPGTYYLKETDAPTGFAKDNSVWKVEVVKNDDGTIKVTLSQSKDGNGNPVTDNAATVCYDGGIKASYQIYNAPSVNTVRVTKTFSGLSIEELNRLVVGSTEGYNGYYIEVRPETGATDQNTAKLCLKNSTRSQDGWTFTWVISNLAMVDANENPIQYEIVEHNYFVYDENGAPTYKDVAITAAVDGEAKDVSVVRSNDPTTNRISAVATVSNVTFKTDQSDLVELTNEYTNTFNLTLKKVDSVTKEALPNAVFDVYGPYRESTNSSRQITYTGPDGNPKTAYYIDTIKADGNGIAVKEGLSLSEDGTATFVYVINESFAPSGYAKLDEPIVQTVSVNTDGYAHGVYTADVPNIREENYVHRTLNVAKRWNPDPAAGTKVTLELYRVSHDQRNTALPDVVDAEKIGTVTLDGMPDSNEEGVTAYESAPWTATWVNLPSASGDYETTQEHYHYFVREVGAPNGYTASYACVGADGKVPQGAIQKLQVTKEDGSTETFEAVLIADMDEAYTAGVTNTEHFALPRTGGAGVLPYAMGGTLLMAGGLLCGYLLRRKRERRHAR